MRKNILILGHNYATQFVDICNQYVKLFDPDKFKVTVAYLSGEPDAEAKARTLSEEVIFLNCSKRDIRGLKISAIRKVVALCKERQFEIVICHRYKPIYIMLWAAQFVNIPKIFFVMHAMFTLNSLPRRLLIAALVRPNMYFAGVSDAVRNDLRKNLWRIADDHVITLNNCIDIDITEPQIISREDARAFFNLSPDTFVFGLLGRLAREKNHTTLLDAFAKVKARLPKTKLLLIGDGPLEEKLRKQAAELNLTDDVIFAGFLPQGFRYLKAMDLCLLVSTKEAFGRSLLEAMVARVPIMGSRTNGIPEVVTGAGLTVEARDAQAMAQAMMYYAKLSEEDLMAQQVLVYRHVREKFSIEKFREIFWEIK